MNEQMLMDLEIQDQLNRKAKMIRILAEAIQAMHKAGASPTEVVNALRLTADDIAREYGITRSTDEEEKQND